MTDPLTAGALVTLATLATQEFVKSGTGELAKKFTAEAIAKIPELWTQIKTKLSGKSVKVDEALAKLEAGDRTGLETVSKNLDVVMDEDEIFADKLRQLAVAIRAGTIEQVGLENVKAKRIAAEIEQETTSSGAKEVKQTGARGIEAEEDTIFKIKQNID